MTDTTTRATTRTWNAHTTYRECGVVTGTTTYAVTITRAGASFTAEVDGCPTDVLTADRILRSADRIEKVAETLEATIGNATACELHKQLGKLGFRAHYLTASEALGRPITSLAALSAAEAYTVRDYARGQWGMTA